jgi:hypothetical protein
METNDLVTELERIKAKRATIFSLKSLCVVGRKTHEVTRSTSKDEFRVNLEENGLSEWHESQGVVQRIPGSKLCSYSDKNRYE